MVVDQETVGTPRCQVTQGRASYTAPLQHDYSYEIAAALLLATHGQHRREWCFDEVAY